MRILFCEECLIRPAKKKCCSRTCAARRNGKRAGDKLRGTGKSHIRVRIKSERVYLHRLVMEQKLGRKLSPDEIVHHKNENKHDNRPCNLELLTGDARAKHLAKHNYHRDRGSTFEAVPVGNETFYF